jgi:hypothetical protein
MAYKRRKFLRLTLTLTLFTMLFEVVAVIHNRTWAGSLDTTKSVRKIDEKCLVGRWIRPDGGYVLHIKGIGKDGSLKAAYFNPRPINVYRAEVNCRKGQCTLFVELRDVNYPGSRYDLRYDQKSDRLIGTYFQAVAGETYHIEFIRMQ